VYEVLLAASALMLRFGIKEAIHPFLYTRNYRVSIIGTEIDG
jgi:hypothetical protein